MRSMHGICTRPPIGSQVSPRLCSMPISAAFSTCSGCRPAPRSAPAAAIEQAEPTSPWQPTSAPEIDAFSLNSTPTAPRREQEAHHGVVVGAGDEPRVVGDDRGDDAGRAVGRGRSRCGRPPRSPRSRPARTGSPSPSPGAGRVRPRSLLSWRWSWWARRCTFRPPGSTPSREDPRRTHSSMTRHRFDQARLDLGLGAAEGLLVGHHQAGDRQARLGAAAPAVSPAVQERMGEHGVVGFDAVGAGGVLVDDEAAADRVVDLLSVRSPASPRAVKRMPLGWPGSEILRSKTRSSPTTNGTACCPIRRHRARLAHRGQHAVDRVDVDEFGLLAGQAQQHGLVAAVALAGQAEGAVQDDLDLRGLLQQTVVSRTARELVRGGHRAARVGSWTARCRP